MLGFSKILQARHDDLAQRDGQRLGDRRFLKRCEQRRHDIGTLDAQVNQAKCSFFLVNRIAARQLTDIATDERRLLGSWVGGAIFLGLAGAHNFDFALDHRIAAQF